MKKTFAYLCLFGLATMLVLGCSDDSSPKPDGNRPRDGSISEAGADLKRPKPDAPKKVITIKSIIPDNGPACPLDPKGPAGNCDGSVEVVLTGENFEAGATIYIDGGAAAGGIITQVNVTSAASLSFRMPKQPYDTASPYKAEIRVLIGGEQSNEVYYQYTVTEQATDDFKGALDDKLTDAYRDFKSVPIHGRVFVKDKTKETTGAVDRLVAEVGISATGKNPTTSYGFRWFPATFLKDDGDYDVYQARVTPWLEQGFTVAYRFSQDNGRRWIYVDSDPSDLAFTEATAGTLAVEAPPLYYCQQTADCTLETYNVVCKPGATWKDGRCVQCLEAKDCTGNKNALGPHCSNTNKCHCTEAADCATNDNGKACMPEQYCGCQQPTDCVEPDVCYQDKPAKGMFGCDPPQPTP